MPTLDSDRLRAVQVLVFSKLEGAMTAGMIHLGDKLGLYRALAASDAPLTSAELAERAGLAERWVREWAYNQAAARIVTVDDAERFSLSPEAAAVLADSTNDVFGMGWFHDLPQAMATLETLPDSFRTGLGRNFDSRGREVAVGMERSFEPWNRAHLASEVVPALDDVKAKLTAGGRVVDVGCGAGGAVLLLAEEFPASRVEGYDISEHALARAAERLAESGLTNASFHDARVEPLPADHSVDLVTTFDCIHDMTDPQGMTETIRAALRDDGTWLLVDIKALDSFAGNAARNPMAPLMYGVSVISCMSSGLSEPGGAGLGTLGLSPERAEQMTRAAGFTRFRTLPVEHPVNAFYAIRP
jgi:2-polyprenyl-3-methyl-5-hydroxy-6-metoxy-1,4-benzoquinol methylase